MAELGAEAFDFVHEVQSEAQRGGFEGVVFSQVLNPAQPMQAFVIVESRAGVILCGWGNQTLLMVVDDGFAAHTASAGDEVQGVGRAGWGFDHWAVVGGGRGGRAHA